MEEQNISIKIKERKQEYASLLLILNIPNRL